MATGPSPVARLRPIAGHVVHEVHLEPVAGHGPDFLFANDAWARFINLRYGPDGNVYLIDWYDQQACHNKNDAIWDRSNGRIYKLDGQQ